MAPGADLAAGVGATRARHHREGALATGLNSRARASLRIVGGAILPLSRAAHGLLGWPAFGAPP
jgi:hypothetical protein